MIPTFSSTFLDFDFKQVPFALGEMMVGLVAYYQQDWSTLQIIMSSLVLGLTILWFFMPESPRQVSKSSVYLEKLVIRMKMSFQVATFKKQIH